MLQQVVAHHVQQLARLEGSLAEEKLRQREEMQAKLEMQRKRAKEVASQRRQHQELQQQQQQQQQHCELISDDEQEKARGCVAVTCAAAHAAAGGGASRAAACTPRGQSGRGEVAAAGGDASKAGDAAQEGKGGRVAAAAAACSTPRQPTRRPARQVPLQLERDRAAVRHTSMQVRSPERRPAAHAGAGAHATDTRAASQQALPSLTITPPLPPTHLSSARRLTLRRERLRAQKQASASASASVSASAAAAAAPPAPHAQGGHAL
jgi:hypothetical protein